MPDSSKHNVTQQKMGNRAPKEEFASGSADDLINHQGGGSSAEGPTVDLSLQFFESSSEEGNWILDKANLAGGYFTTYEQFAHYVIFYQKSLT